MNFVKALVRIFVGAVFGGISMLALIPAFAAFTSPDNAAYMWIVVLISAIFGFFAPTIRRAFGRGFLLAGICFLALPISTMLLSGRVAHDAVSAASPENQAGTAVGAGLAGVAMTGISAFIGIILGAIFLITGLILALGGRREVIVVQSRDDRGFERL